MIGERAGRSRCIQVDSKNSFLGINAATKSAAAVDNHYQNFIIGNTSFKTVDEFATGHLCERLRNFRHDAAGDVDDFIFLAVGYERQGSAESAATRLDDYRFIISLSNPP